MQRIVMFLMFFGGGLVFKGVTMFRFTHPDDQFPIFVFLVGIVVTMVGLELEKHNYYEGD